MTEAITSYAGSLLIVGLIVCYVTGVPTPAQLKQHSQALFKPLLGCFYLIARVFHKPMAHKQVHFRFGNPGARQSFPNPSAMSQ
jgi:hypothetical protein